MLTVAIASSDSVSSSQLLAALQQSGMTKSIKQWSIPAEKLPDATEVAPDVIFLDLSRDPEHFFSFAVHIRRVRPAVKLVAVSSAVPPSPQLLLEAMRSGVQDFLPKPANPDALRAMLARLAQDLEVIDRPTAEKLGVQLATFAKKRVVLLDFAQPLGNVHLLLDLHLRFNVRDAVENMDRLDNHFFAGLLTQHKTKLDILGGITQPEEWQRIGIPPL